MAKELYCTFLFDSFLLSLFDFFKQRLLSLLLELSLEEFVLALLYLDLLGRHVCHLSTLSPGYSLLVLAHSRQADQLFPFVIKF